MNWKRPVIITATALSAVLIAVAPTAAMGLTTTPQFNLTAPCPPGSISLIRRVAILFKTPLRPCLLKPLLSVSPQSTGSLAASPRPSTTLGTTPPTATAPLPPTRQPAPRPLLPRNSAPSAHHPPAGSGQVHAPIPVSTLTQTTPMAPAPAVNQQSTRTASSAPQSTTSAAGTDQATNYCPRWVHDQYVTTGPDGNLYPTWHPLVDPVYGCMFNHEHGADPTTSGANSSLPPLGYAAAQAGMTEAHEGYKVFILNAGDVADDGRTLQADYRIVFHMGTSGTRRYIEGDHSMIYDYVARDGSGREAHISGLADTGPAELDGSTCDNPRKGARDFSTIGCDDTYEIWGFEFSIKHPDDPFQDPTHVRTYVSGSVATFDPVLTRDPSDNYQVVYTQTYRGDPFDFGRGDGTQVNPISADAYYQGCQRESYGGPNYWSNAGQPTTYYTDAWGNVRPGPGPGLIQQMTSDTTSGSNELYKIRQDFCQYGEYPPD